MMKERERLEKKASFSLKCRFDAKKTSVRVLGSDFLIDSLDLMSLQLCTHMSNASFVKPKRKEPTHERK